MRLDTGFYQDHKVEHLESIKRGEGVYRFLKLCCIAHEKYGQIDLNDKAIRVHVEKRMGLSEKRLTDFIDVCVECDLFSADKWEEKVVTSCRLMAEGLKRYNSEQQRLEASEKAAEARRKKAIEKELEGEES